MGKEIITFGDIKVEKFHGHQNQILIYAVNIDRIIVSNKVPFGKKGFKYFIGCENNYEKVVPLCIMLSKMSAYRRDFDEAKCVSF